MENQKRVLSCIQPTGQIHYGNYFGATKNWVALQAQYQCFYGIVDYHAITAPYSPKKLRENTWDLAFNLLSVGIEPKNLFIQSLIPEHAELCWILHCFTSYGQLSRMTQFKDKSAQQKQGADGFISAGLFSYPVLQAADILIYKAHYVPVGKDQEQHLELSRNIAERFNNQLGKNCLIPPEPLFTPTPKIMSTADPTRKMSKSAGEKHHISLFADENRIRKQIRSAVTDTGTPSEGKMSPGIQNLFQLLQASGQQALHDQLKDNYHQNTLQYADLKEAVADALVALSNQFKNKKAELLADKKNIKNKIKETSTYIRQHAKQTLREVKELAGLLTPKL